MAFAGIPVAALDFYEDLENDNSKLFWTEHKHIYDDSVKAPLTELSNELEKNFGPWKMFRPYRDVRFAKDKTPYKTAQGVWFGESSLYLQVSAAGLFLGGGYYHLESAQIARLRRAVADDVAGPLLERTVATVRRKGLAVRGEQITRVPSGYPKDHPRAELLRHKSLSATKALGAPAWLSTPKARGEISKIWRNAVPLVTWLDTHVGRD